MSSEPTRITTYKQADDGLVWGEFGWVTDLEFFDDHDGDPIELVKEVWVRESIETITHHPTPCFCPTCDPQLAADNAADEEADQ